MCLDRTETIMAPGQAKRKDKSATPAVGKEESPTPLMRVPSGAGDDGPIHAKSNVACKDVTHLKVQVRKKTCGLHSPPSF